MRTFIFACVHNAGRSQISAAFFNHFVDPLCARAISAGTKPATRVHIVVVEAMQEVGIDLSDYIPQKLTPELAHDAEMLITMGCGEDCPYLPGLERDDWPFPDPKDQQIAAVSRLREEIRHRVIQFIESRGLAVSSTSA